MTHEEKVTSSNQLGISGVWVATLEILGLGVVEVPFVLTELRGSTCGGG
jgi:hypothetical protein